MIHLLTLEFSELVGYNRSNLVALITKIEINSKLENSFGMNRWRRHYCVRYYTKFFQDKTIDEKERTIKLGLKIWPNLRKATKDREMISYETGKEHSRNWMISKKKPEIRTMNKWRTRTIDLISKYITRSKLWMDYLTWK